MGNKHEDQVCNTVIGFIAKRKHLTISEICCPDKEKKKNVPSVDRLIKCLGAEIVLEHTLIESYPEQIADSKIVEKLLGPLKAQLVGELPKPGHYELSIDVGAVKGAKATKSIQKALFEWIKKKAPLLQVGSPNVAPAHYIREKLAGVPFEVGLYRFPRHDGRFWITLALRDDLREKRRQRICRALNDKCPKLFDAKGDKRTSILVLESNDICLGNSCEIARSVTEELKAHRDAPDEVYLVETELKRWTIWILKDATNSFQDMANPGPYYVKPGEDCT